MLSNIVHLVRFAIL